MPPVRRSISFDEVVAKAVCAVIRNSDCWRRCLKELGQLENNCMADVIKYERYPTVSMKDVACHAQIVHGLVELDLGSKLTCAETMGHAMYLCDESLGFKMSGQFSW